MPKAIWNGTVIADASDDQVEVVEGNVYFPMQAVHRDYLVPSHTVKHAIGIGRAGHFHVVVNNQVNEDAAWIYRNPAPVLKNIADHIAFRNSIEIQV